MEKIRLGRTHLTVTKMGWGGIPIQRVSEEEAVSVVRAVIEMGVDLLDSARGYTTSEHRIGLALKGVDKPVVLSTKSQVRTEKIYDAIKESLQQLMVKKIDIYHVHGIRNFEDYEKIMDRGGAYEGLRRARDEGLIDHIGATNHSLDVLEKVIEDGYFEVIMTWYSFLEPEAARRIFPRAKRKDVGVLAMKPFSGGVIEDAGPALRYVLSTPDIVSIPGSETLKKAHENWKVFMEGHTLTEKDKEQIEAMRKEYDRQFCRRCDYCQLCTENIPIQHILGLRALIKRRGRPAQGEDRLRKDVEKARNCSECGECLPRCPYQLPIPDLIKENLSYYDSLA